MRSSCLRQDELSYEILHIFKRLQLIIHIVLDLKIQERFEHPKKCCQKTDIQHKYVYDYAHLKNFAFESEQLPSNEVSIIVSGLVGLYFLSLVCYTCRSQ